jgi:hypothetical protein
VKWLQQPEPVPGEFGAHTSEEAVRLARAALGRDAPVRCWKTRSGGVLGFFAKEAFVAGINPPAGAVKAVKTTKAATTNKSTKAAKTATTVKAAHPAPPAPPGGEPDEPASTRPAAPTSPRAAASGPEQLSLSQLIERTSDEVTLGAAPLRDAAFSEVLAEAEAAVSGAAPPARSVPAKSDPPPEPAGAAWIEGLAETLAHLGVPAEYRPPESAATFDALARALATLPQAPPLPAVGGSVVAVVGAKGDARLAAEQVRQSLGLDPSHLIVIDPSDAGRQRVARRRAANKVTVLALECSVRSRTVDAVAAWLDKVEPDHVLGAVPATAKRSDVALWRTRLGRLDALALTRLAATATPGELMGELPIALIDGRDASTLRWVLTLLHAGSDSGR